MYIDFSKLTRDAYGNLEQPTMILKRPHGEIIGVLKNAFNRRLDLKFSETSTASFDYPFSDGHVEMPYYHDLTKDKLVEIIPYGVFIIESYKDYTSGSHQYRSVELQSREFELSEKHLVIGEGVYNLWNPAAQNDTILSYVLEGSPGWSIGEISPSLIGRYRTFKNVDTNVLDFLMNEVQESYGCVIVFDSFTKRINLLDADLEAEHMPVYFSYENLVKEGTISQLGDPVCTELYVVGAEGVDIRNVNPTGDNYIYNLDWYIENGDIPDLLAYKWRQWENSVFANQPAYTSLIAQRNAQMASKSTLAAEVVDLSNQKKTQEGLRDAALKGLVTIKKDTPSGAELYDETEAKIQEYGTEIEKLSSEIQNKEAQISDYEERIQELTASALSINNKLHIKKYFTRDELVVLEHYFKYGSFQDSTFAVFDADIGNASEYIKVDSIQFKMEDIEITTVESPEDVLSGRINSGTLIITENTTEPATKIRASIVNGTIELTQDTDSVNVVASYYLSPIYINEESYGSGSLTLTGSVGSMSVLTNGLVQSEIIEYSPDQTLSRYVYRYTGAVNCAIQETTLCLTKSVSEYQQYCIQQELYDYAKLYLADVARPQCEFDIQTANFLTQKEFDAFRNCLQLGHSAYLSLQNGLILNPVLLEIHINVDDPSDFTTVFSNVFRRPRDVERLADTIREVSAASREYSANKFLYGKVSDTTTFVKTLLTNGLDAALAQISAGTNNTVTIDEMGITVESTDNYDTIRINNGMVALVDKANNVVKMAMGHFLDAGGNDYVGIMADVIAGTLLAGQNLVIECDNPNGGVMQFKVDSSGVVVNNGRWYMKSNSGCIAMDPNYGFMAGKKDLFAPVDSGHITPKCIDENGLIILDDDGFPVDTNVWIGIDGKVYLRGAIYAEEGRFNGVVQASDYLDKTGKSMLTSSGKFDGRILETETVVAANLQGERIDIMLDEDTVAGYIDTRDADTGDYGINMTSHEAMAFIAKNGSVYLESRNDEMDDDDKGVAINLYSPVDENEHAVTFNRNIHGAFNPDFEDGFDLGTNWFRWRDAYLYNNPIVTSDATHKTDFQYDLSDMDGFYDALRPVSYKLIRGQSGRTHIGYVAQDVEMALDKNGLTSMDFAGFIKTPRDDAYDYSLRYSEFIALNTWQIQQLKTRIAELEDKLAKLTQEVN